MKGIDKMKYGYKEVRRLHSTDLRALCIRENWYTGGTNEEYANLMEMTKKDNITTDDIVEIATDIIEHSGKAVEEIKASAGLTTSEVYTHFMYLINEACHTFFTEA